MVKVDEIKNNIERTCIYLSSQLSNIYDSPELKDEANDIIRDLVNINESKDKALEELEELQNRLQSTFTQTAKLLEKAEEVKSRDEFLRQEKERQKRFLDDYQNKLLHNYGDNWFAEMSSKEREEYVSLYSASYEVPRSTVEKMIDNSIKKAYEEKVAKMQQEKQQEKENFVGQYENMIRFEVRTGVDNLKNIYSKINKGTQEQIEEFNYLYSTLSSLSKMKPTSQEEENEKLRQIQDITSRIDTLNNSLNKSNVIEM